MSAQLSACENQTDQTDAFVADSVIKVVSQAMDIVGGQAYYREMGLEKLFRDVQGARYHPIYEADQLQFSGNYLLRQ